MLELKKIILKENKGSFTVIPVWTDGKKNFKNLTWNKVPKHLVGRFYNAFLDGKVAKNAQTYFSSFENKEVVECDICIYSDLVEEGLLRNGY